MKILFVTSGAYIPEFTGGIESTIHDMSVLLQQRGLSPGVMARLRKRTLRARLHGSRRLLGLGQAVLRDTGLGYPVYRMSRPTDRVGEVVDAFHPDVAIVQRGRIRQFAEAFRQAGVPVLVYLHHANFHHMSDSYPSEGVGYVANARFTADEFARETGLPADVLFPVVDRTPYLTETRGDAVLFINPVAVKGLEVALYLAQARPDIPFIFVESWPLDRAAWTALQKRTEACANIQLIRRTQDMRSLYARARVLLVPSQWDEPWGRVVTEAQMNGIPALATNRGGLPESVGTGGLLVDADAEPSAWLEALGQMWDDADTYAALSTEASHRSSAGDVAQDHLMDEFLRIVDRQIAATNRGQKG